MECCTFCSFVLFIRHWRKQRKKRHSRIVCTSQKNPCAEFYSTHFNFKINSRKSMRFPEKTLILVESEWLNCNAISNMIWSGLAMTHQSLMHIQYGTNEKYQIECTLQLIECSNSANHECVHYEYIFHWKWSAIADCFMIIECAFCARVWAYMFRHIHVFITHYAAFNAFFPDIIARLPASHCHHFLFVCFCYLATLKRNYVSKILNK